VVELRGARQPVPLARWQMSPRPVLISGVTNMHTQSIRFSRVRGIAALTAALLLGTIARAADPDSTIQSWLGKEITIQSSSAIDLMPIGGKLTFIFDSEDNTVRVCTRQASSQRGSWRMDMVPGCNVALAVTRGERYCTIEDVKAGNAEVLSACHRLRSHDVALRPSKIKGSLELHDVIVFPIEGSTPGALSIAILVDSPSRVTDGGIFIGSNK
jgi:hypothetical protein